MNAPDTPLLAVDLGAVNLRAGDLARVDAWCAAHGTTRKGWAGMAVRSAARALPAAPKGTP